MRKELVISSIPQETRVAVIEDGELVEFLIERRRSQGIAGNIYKGRVTKVLPGMQSAFVDIGLERDAFLYVSDFLEDSDEYERMVSGAEDAVLSGDARRANGRSRARGREPKPRDRVESSAQAATSANADAPASENAPGRTEAASERTEAASGQTEAAPGRTEAASGRTEEASGRRDATELPKASERPGRVETPSRPPSAPGGPSDRSPDLAGERRSGRRGDRPKSRPRTPAAETPSRPRSDSPVSVETGEVPVLPGESLKKYRGAASPVEDVSGKGAGAPAPVSDAAPAGPAEAAPGERAEAAPGERAEAAPGERAEAAPEETSAVERSDRDGVVEERAAGSPGTPPPVVEDSGPDEEASPSPVEAEPAGDAPEGSSPAEEDAAGGDPPDGEVRRARIIDRGSSGALTRKAPSRTRRRAGGSSDSDVVAGAGPAPTISDLLKEGQEILVQVSKEPLGKKGARITSHVALPGRYIVYMPTVDHVGVSRKIASGEERARLRRVIAENRQDLQGGFIVRTAADGRDEAEFVRDLRFLSELWKEIRERRERAAAPAVIHSDLGLVERVLRDQLSDDFKAIRLDSETEYAKVLDFVSKFQPSLVNRVKLHLKNTPIFEEFGLQQEIDKAMRSKVWLKSGGYIVVNQTEALVAIDVNTGKFVGKSNRLEDTIVRTNLDAVHEIVRQLRLRNLGGIIVVDFIDMEERKNRQRVMQALEEALQKDRFPSKILQFNDFGLVAITRKRTHASLERVLGTPCPRCSGSGYVKAVETVCYEIQQELRKMLGQVEGDEVTVRVGPDVAKALKSAEFVDLTEIEEESRKDIRVQSDPTLPAERFDVYE